MSVYRSFVNACRAEYHDIFTDIGVMIMFFLLPTAYPMVYTLIYNTELLTDMPIVVVDQSASPESNRLIRMVDATQEIAVSNFAPDIIQARRLMAEGDCCAILFIPSDYASRQAVGDQSIALFYADTSRLLRYRDFTSALTDVNIALIDADAPIENIAFVLGDPNEGFASFIIPGILVIILQQSMILGVAMLSGRRREKHLQYMSWCYPLPQIAVYLSLYIPLSLFGLIIIPRIFALPAMATLFDTLIIIVPMLIASSLLGMIVGEGMREAESVFLFVVFTSPIVLFLSGLTWPRYAMSPLWYAISSLFPSTWAVNDFVRLNSLGATPAHYSIENIILSLAFLLVLIIIKRYHCSRFLWEGKINKRDH